MAAVRRRRLLLWIGVLFNLGLLGYFKYFGFFLSICNQLAGTQWTATKIILPLGISFYTFQQLAYLVDAYTGKVLRCSFWEYLLFVAYFPQLVAGPIVHYSEMIPQFRSVRAIKWELMYEGILVFLVGLAKKVFIADTLAKFVNLGYASIDRLTFLSAWLVSLSYTFQLYFDFSGYADMAIGSGLLFGIRLPENFNSPYKALDIQDFWSRWHMTLSAWLKHYVYIPMGGNRKGIPRVLANLFLTFLIGGIWHGAGWTFVVWGAMHGTAVVLHRCWKLSGLSLHRAAAWILTFNFVNVAWVFFRSDTVAHAANVARKLCDVQSIAYIFGQITETTTLGRLWYFLFGQWIPGRQVVCTWIISLCGALLVAICSRNTKAIMQKYATPHFFKTLLMVAVVWGAWAVLQRRVQIDFLYWQF
jgi:D-alanyl-lipoteichoic acid acyltransferase DltB (MBOAT superfamily)